MDIAVHFRQRITNPFLHGIHVGFFLLAAGKLDPCLRDLLTDTIELFFLPVVFCQASLCGFFGFCDRFGIFCDLLLQSFHHLRRMLLFCFNAGKLTLQPLTAAADLPQGCFCQLQFMLFFQQDPFCTADLFFQIFHLAPVSADPFPQAFQLASDFILLVVFSYDLFFQALDLCFSIQDICRFIFIFTTGDGAACIYDFSIQCDKPQSASLFRHPYRVIHIIYDHHPAQQIRDDPLISGIESQAFRSKPSKSCFLPQPFFIRRPASH